MPNQSSNLLRRLIEEVINQGHLEMMTLLVHPDYVDHDVYPGEPEGTRESLTAFFAELRAALPDLRFEPLQDETVDGDQIWGRYMASGTMTGGPLFGQPPTRRFARWREIHWVRVDSATGLIIEHFGAGADLDMLAELGLQAPQPPSEFSDQRTIPGAL